MNVLIYDGPGVCNLQKPLISVVRRLLRGKFDVIPVNHKIIANSPWESTTKLIIFPGGRDLCYLSSLESTGIQKLKNYVNNGGNYLGICGGAYFACDALEFELGRAGYEVTGSRPLKFCPAKAIGSVANGFIYENELGAQAMKILGNDSSLDVYVNGGPYFKLDKDAVNTEVLFTYECNNEPAIVLSKVGSGKSVVCGPHLEVSAEILREKISLLENSASEIDKLNQKVYSKILPAIEKSEENRERLFVKILDIFGLKVDENTKDILQSPIYFASADPVEIHDFEKNLSTMLINPKEHILVDEGEINLQNLSLAEKAPLLWTPFNGQILEFDIANYFNRLNILRKSNSKSFGNFLLYTNAIRSTQTTLEELFGDTNFSQILPNGTICLSTYQTHGRGRGTNSWISQKGCLMFSLKIDHNKVASVVFIQYLFALSVAQAINQIPGCEDLPVRLKWPNDIYVVSKDGLKKIGGILVTSEFKYETSTFRLIIGCGLNVLNSSPSTCLKDFVECKLDLETTLALIINRFEILFKELDNYNRAHDCFLPFKDRYYRFWLHSNQIVTVRNAEGLDEEMQIMGLDENGFLKAKSIDGKNKFVSLQPDGNTFDMMKNLISVKTS